MQNGFNSKSNVTNVCVCVYVASLYAIGLIFRLPSYPPTIAPFHTNKYLTLSLDASKSSLGAPSCRRFGRATIFAIIFYNPKEHSL